MLVRGKVNTRVNINKWVHLLLQVEKSNSTPNSIRVFKDGKIDFESELDWFKFNGTNFHLRIGHLPKMGDYYFNGSLMMFVSMTEYFPRPRYKRCME